MAAILPSTASDRAEMVSSSVLSASAFAGVRPAVAEKRLVLRADDLRSPSAGCKPEALRASREPCRDTGGAEPDGAFRLTDPDVIPPARERTAEPGEPRSMLRRSSASSSCESRLATIWSRSCSMSCGSVDQKSSVPDMPFAGRTPPETYNYRRGHLGHLSERLLAGLLGLVELCRKLSALRVSASSARASWLAS
jgi:hypothetical protein